MNIAVLVADIGPSAGGLYYSVRAMSRGVASISGNHLEVFAPGEYPESVFKHWAPIRPRTFAAKISEAYKYAPGMQRAVVDFNPDLIHSHGLWMYNSRVAKRTHRICGAPIVVSPRGMLDPWAVKNSKWKKRLMAYLQEYSFLNSVDCFHALNESEAESIRELGYRQPICILPNGTDLPDLSASTNLKYPSSSKRLVFVGRIHPKKGLNLLIQALGMIRRENPKQLQGWEVLIAGWDDGGHLASYQALTKDCGCEDLISWPGSVYGEQKDALLRSATAFILPSYSEGLPMAIVEAWAYQLPVLMTSQCNLPEGFDIGAAIRIDTNPESLTTGINQLISLDSGALSSMGLRGRRLVEDKFTWERQTLDIQEVYQWLRGKGQPPTCVV